MMRLAILTGALLATAVPAQVGLIESPTAAVPTCPSGPVPGFHHFDHPEVDALTVGAPAKLALAPAAGQSFTPPLNRAPEADSYGGTFPLVIATAGTYRIALSAKVWIDLIDKGVAIHSAAHTHGPECSGIAKIVDFTLAPGTYQVQLSDTKEKSLTAMVVLAK